MQSVLDPKRPQVQNWRRATWWTCPPQLAEMGYPVEAWEHPSSGLFCLSALEVAHEPAKPALGPEYHLSVSMNGQRCTSVDAMFVLASFGLEDAKEDNHVPSGRVRHFWRPVADNLSGYECACVDDEPAIREDKGDFVWRGMTA
jgi:hypothetical protein